MFSLCLKKVALLLLLLSLVSVACSTTKIKTTTASDAMSLRSEAMKIWNRPLEMGFKVVGMDTGTATSTDAEQAVATGSGSKSKPSFFLSGSVPASSLSPLAKLAAFNIVKKNKADGIFVTMVHETDNPESGKSVWVKGILLQLVIYDPVSVERSDEVRKCEKGCSERFVIEPVLKSQE